MVTACAFHLPLISEKWRSEKQNTQLCSVQWFQDYGKNVVKCHQSPFSGSRLRLYSFLIFSVQGYLLFEWLLSKSSQQVTFILAFSKRKWYLFDPRHRLCISEECYMLWWQFFLLLCGFFFGILEHDGILVSPFFARRKISFFWIVRIQKNSWIGNMNSWGKMWNRTKSFNTATR